MKLYEVTNGFIGESYVRMLAIAPTEERALSIAHDEYDTDAGTRHGGHTILFAKLLCDDVSKEWHNNITDG